MKKLDRLGWAAGISFKSYGARIGIRVNDLAAFEHLLDYMPPAWKPSSSPIVDDLFSLIVGGTTLGDRVRRYNLLYWSSERLARTMDLDEVLETLESSLHFSVALRARRRLFVHAGVVSWRGRAIVIPGLSSSGKTTLVEALVRAGGTYYSDEYAVFDTSGRVYPYAKPLSIKGKLDERPKKCVVEGLDRLGFKPLPVGLVVVTEYKPNARWRPRVLSPGKALLALLDNTVLARVRSKFALKTLQRAVSSAIALKGKRGEAQNVVPSLLKRLEESIG